MSNFVQSYYFVTVVHSFFKLINKIIYLFIHLIYLIYFYIDAEKPFLGMVNEVYVCMYVCHVCMYVMYVCMYVWIYEKMASLSV